MGHIASDAYERFRYNVADFTTDQLRLLLETKHLYQKVSLQPDEILSSLMPPEPSPAVLGLIGAESEKSLFLSLASAFLSQDLTVADKLVYDKDRKPMRCLVVRNVKLFCATCEGREVFRPIWFVDVTKQMFESGEEKAQRANVIVSFESLQLFVLVYQCQRCEGIPVAFLVKFDETQNLILGGRFPIEHMEIHSAIPNKEAKWFRNAVIAYQSGKTLAGLFYLRTFIEQFARRVTEMLDIKETGDAILSAYSDTLPPKIRDSAPSLKEWYDKLSEAIHGAKDDAELFEAAKAQIEKHFEFRKVYDI
jgi:hypothetical protein